MSTLRFRTALLRNHPDLPVFIRSPGAIVAPWGLSSEWKSVEGTLNGHDFGRRGLKDCGKNDPDWYVELLKPFLEKAKLSPGDAVYVEMRLADMTMPAELAERMANDAGFARAYEALIPNHKRNVIELYLSAKTPAGRTAKLDKIDREIKAMLARRERPA